MNDSCPDFENRAGALPCALKAGHPGDHEAASGVSYWRNRTAEAHSAREAELLLSALKELLRAWDSTDPYTADADFAQACFDAKALVDRIEGAK